MVPDYSLINFYYLIMEDGLIHDMTIPHGWAMTAAEAGRRNEAIKAVGRTTRWMCQKDCSAGKLYNLVTCPRLHNHRIFRVCSDCGTIG